jgi:hypothetical protein
MTEAADPNRPEAELQKLRLEIQKLTLDVASAREREARRVHQRPVRVPLTYTAVTGA